VILARLREALGAEGLHLALPLDQAALDRGGVEVSLAALLPGARGALVVGDGGGTFFARFHASGDTTGPHPLDRYTVAVVAGAVARALDGESVQHAIRFPFATERPYLPIQRLGQAAGLPPPGPLGIQVHPTYGPWWAYRALVVLTCELGVEPPLPAPCQGCPAPCVSACPGGAVRPDGFGLEACARHRGLDAGCHFSCAARQRCVAGPGHRYPPEQLRFHMAASLAQLTATR
jgi:hypothetical protein